MIKRVCINCGVENYSDDAAIMNWQCVNYDAYSSTNLQRSFQP